MEALEDTLEVHPLILVLKLDYCIAVDPSMSLTVLVVVVFLFRFPNPAMVVLPFSDLDCSMMTSCPMMTCPMTLSMTVVSTLLLAGQVFGCLSLLVSTRTLVLALWLEHLLELIVHDWLASMLANRLTILVP